MARPAGEDGPEAEMAHQRHTLAGPSEKDSVLALALARGLTQAEAAKKAGVSPRTVKRRVEDPAFRELVTSARHRLHDRSVGRLADASDRAISKLLSLLNADDEAVQHRAAKTLLDQNVRFGQYHDLAEQVAEIRESLKARGGG